jgi:hypothetical protein
MYSIYYQAIQKKKKTDTQRQEDRSYEQMCSKVLGQRNAGVQDSEGAARRVLICQTLGLECCGSAVAARDKNTAYPQCSQGYPEAVQYPLSYILNVLRTYRA